MTGHVTNIILIISKESESGKIVWKLSPDCDRTPEEKAIGWIIGRHHEHMIPKGLPGAGNILVFDNGGWGGYDNPNLSAPKGVKVVLCAYSRVLKIDPVTKKIVWQYTPNRSGFSLPRGQQPFL